MSPVAKQIIELVDVLPEVEQNLAYEFIKRMVLAWDPDFTNLTPTEKITLENAKKEVKLGDVGSMSDIDW